MKIGIASDHRGYSLKGKLIAYLQEKYQVCDYGTDSKDSVDYPDYAFTLGKAVVQKKVDCGILICGTGIGISIAANKVRGIRCAKIDNNNDAKYAKMHNNANIIAFGEDTSLEKAQSMIDTYLETQFSEEEKHHRRVAKIDSYQN